LETDQKCIGLLFGGESEEHTVSIKSAVTVAKAFGNKENKKKFNILPIYIDRKGRWWEQEIAEKILDKGELAFEKNYFSDLPYDGFTSLPIGCEKIDIWFPLLHGPNGEDGTIQGLFKLSKKPFVGSSVLGSALGLDKIAMKSAFSSAGIPQLPYVSTTARNIKDENSLLILIKQVEEKLEYPVFIKPANLGSSIGITRAKNTKELVEGLYKAINYDERIVIEQGIKARELECAVLGNKHMRASEIGEVNFDAEWYDYQTKYFSGSSKSIIPAPIDLDVKEEIQRLSLKACHSITVKSLARVDFFYKEETNEIFINEINTLPGFTSQSMYPVLWSASGLPIEKLVAELVEVAGECN
tara:strand:- start:226 stop:1293 length:1068 start_codon:yes stop_codon:yes gene_type:complete